MKHGNFRNTHSNGINPSGLKKHIRFILRDIFSPPDDSTTNAIRKASGHREKTWG
jgi:hypothetical protein